MKAALPAGMRPEGNRKEGLRQNYRPLTETFVRLNPALLEEESRLHEALDSLKRAGKQREALLRFLEEAGLTPESTAAFSAKGPGKGEPGPPRAPLPRPRDPAPTARPATPSPPPPTPPSPPTPSPRPRPGSATPATSPTQKACRNTTTPSSTAGNPADAARQAPPPPSPTPPNPPAPPKAPATAHRRPTPPPRPPKRPHGPSHRRNASLSLAWVLIIAHSADQDTRRPDVLFYCHATGEPWSISCILQGKLLNRNLRNSLYRAIDPKGCAVLAHLLCAFCTGFLRASVERTGRCAFYGRRQNVT